MSAINKDHERLELLSLRIARFNGQINALEEELDRLSYALNEIEGEEDGETIIQDWRHLLLLWREQWITHKLVRKKWRRDQLELRRDVLSDIASL